MTIGYGIRAILIGFSVCIPHRNRRLYGMIYVPSSMKVGTSVRTILRFSPSNFRLCDVDNTDARNFSSVG
jgi:hypothetical protein